MAKVTTLKKNDGKEGLIWKDPPRFAVGAPLKWDDTLRELQAHPERWALIKTAKNIRSARGLAYNTLRRSATRIGGRYEFVTRTNDSGGGDIYARYMGK